MSSVTFHHCCSHCRDSRATGWWSWWPSSSSWHSSSCMAPIMSWMTSTLRSMWLQIMRSRPQIWRSGLGEKDMCQFMGTRYLMNDTQSQNLIWLGLISILVCMYGNVTMYQWRGGEGCGRSETYPALLQWANGFTNLASNLHTTLIKFAHSA